MPSARMRRSETDLNLAPQALLARLHRLRQCVRLARGNDRVVRGERVAGESYWITRSVADNLDLGGEGDEADLALRAV